MTRIAESRRYLGDGRSAAFRAEPLRVSSLRAAAAIASVALCIFCIVYFGAQILRSVL